MSGIYVKGYYFGDNGNGHNIKSNGTDLYPRESLNFKDHDLVDDPVNDETKIQPHRLTSAELDEIVTPPPVGGGGGGGVPTGTILSIMGNHAPRGYLVCDGTLYPIQDFPTLAEYFETEFGTVNHFGGDGTSTFAVPDLQGEFLRGTGGNGSTVGTQQNESLPNITGQFFCTGSDATYSSSGAFYHTTSSYAWGGHNSKTINAPTFKFDASRSNAIYGKSAHVTPTNTSVLYCIKF